MHQTVHELHVHGQLWLLAILQALLQMVWSKA
jgi:hypothetical protein